GIPSLYRDGELVACLHVLPWLESGERKNAFALEPDVEDNRIGRDGDHRRFNLFTGLATLPRPALLELGKNRVKRFGGLSCGGWGFGSVLVRHSTLQPLFMAVGAESPPSFARPGDVRDYPCRACCTISTRTSRVCCGLATSRKNAMRAPRMRSGVFRRTLKPSRSTAVIFAS